MRANNLLCQINIPIHRRFIHTHTPTLLHRHVQVDQEKLSPVATFAELGLDSLDGVEAVMALEEEFSIDISDEQAEKIQSVKDAVDYISVHPNAN